MNYNLLINEKPTNVLKEFLINYKKFDKKINIEKAEQMIKNGIKFYSGKLINGNIYQKYLEDHWYLSLEKYNPDYSFYNDKYYFTDLWVCWHLYSRKYITSILKSNSLKQDISIYSILKNIKSIVDLGCGIAYTTISLKQIFENAKVHGTNICTTKQYEFCEKVGNEYNIQIVPSISHIKHNIDLVVAFEYFEHIENVIEHLLDIVKSLHPKYLFIANSFNTKSFGHFTNYKNGNEIINQSKMTKLFNKTLKCNGYKQIKTKLWNNKPVLWGLND